jgi:hypothetical protein
MKSRAAILSVGLLFVTTAWVEDPQAVSPPVFIIPFDEIDEATLQEEVGRQAVAFLQTLQSHWDRSRAALREAVEGEIVRTEPDKLVFLRSIADHVVLEGYEFREDALVRGQYVVLQRPLNSLNEFIGYYASLKKRLAAVYGTPLEDQIVWENDLYQPVPDYWGVAVMIGHLHYYAAWETEDGTVMLELTGNRHSKLMLEYRARRKGAEA